jgi:predicted XRE-type DNA-binding protein
VAEILGIELAKISELIRGRMTRFSAKQLRQLLVRVRRDV